MKVNVMRVMGAAIDWLVAASVDEPVHIRDGVVRYLPGQFSEEEVFRAEDHFLTILQAERASVHDFDGVKINLVGMILSHAGKQNFEGLILSDDGQELDAVKSLDHLIMEYAKVRYGGVSKIVTVPDSLVPLEPVARWDPEALGGLRWTPGYTQKSFPADAPVVVLTLPESEPR